MDAVVAAIGAQDGAGRFLKARRALRPVVAMQPPDALEQEVHRADLAQQPVEVEIQALFDDLGGDQDTAALPLGLAPVAADDGLLDALAVAEPETGVEQVHGQVGRLTQEAGQALGIIDRVHDDADQGTGRRGADDALDERGVRKGVGQLGEAHGDGAIGWALIIGDRQGCGGLAVRGPEGGIRRLPAPLAPPGGQQLRADRCWQGSRQEDGTAAGRLLAP